MLGDGAVFISVVANHAVVGGTSFWHFYNTWAALCRGASPKLPEFRRNFFRESTVVLRFADGVGPAETFDTDAPLRERIFHFSRDAIRERDLVLPVTMRADMDLNDARAEAARRRRDDHASPGGELPSQAAPDGLPCLLWQRHPERATMATVAELASNNLRWAASRLNASLAAFRSRGQGGGLGSASSSKRRAANRNKGMYPSVRARVHTKDK
ncbi:putative acetyltransferase [Hordeum vulgare]|nr:putative acetyltransferase [Hordeum vulgare]